MIEDEKYRRAKKRVMTIKGFYIHLFFYLTVNMVLFLINMVGALAARS